MLDPKGGVRSLAMTSDFTAYQNIATCVMSQEKRLKVPAEHVFTEHGSVDYRWMEYICKAKPTCTDVTASLG